MYSPRLTKAEMLNNPYWYSSEYNFSIADLRLPNCTCYCLGRLSEIAGKNCKKEAFPNGIPNAKSWMQYCSWEHGNTPKLGSIAVWGGNYGHVATVEQILPNGAVVVSQSNYQAKKDYYSDNYFQTRTYKCEVGKNTSGVGLPFLGYIYNPYAEGDDMLIKFKRSDEYEYKWSVDGNKYGTDYSITTEKGFSDETLVKDGWELMLKVNGSLFYEYGGEYFACGLEKSRGLNNQDIEMSAVSDFNTCMAIAGYEEDLYFGSQKWIIDNMLEKSYCAITGLGLLVGGKKRDDMHKGFEAQWSQISGRTVIGEDKDGNFMSYSFRGETGKSGLTCAQLQDKCLEVGFYNAICLDGGGSVFRQYRNDQNELVYDISTSRKVKNALLLYRRKKDEDVRNDTSSTLLRTLTEENKSLKNEIKALKEKVDELEAEKNEAEELLAKADKVLQEAQNKIARIKEICE